MGSRPHSRPYAPLGGDSRDGSPRWALQEGAGGCGVPQDTGEREIGNVRDLVHNAQTVAQEQDQDREWWVLFPTTITPIHFYAVLYRGEGEIRNGRCLECRMVRRRFGTKSETPWQNLVHNAQTVAQEQAQDREWWVLFPTGLWWVAVICWRPLDGCSYFPGAVGHNGTVHAKRANSDTLKWGFGPSNTAAS